MSASLVGSEMCIRDSLWTSAGSPFLATGARPRPKRQLSLSMEPPGAVSYTHLTLPTICSV
eukprot:5169586-Alexandrium_andersonii.AAC.1